MNIRKVLLAVVALSCFAAVPASAAERIAVVDLDKIFHEYYKSRIAEETIRTQGESYRSYLIQLNDRRQKLIAEARAAAFNAQNVALSPEEAAKDAVETESSKPSFGGGKHIIPNETLRIGLAGSLLAIGCASGVLAIIEMQNKKASQELLDANNAMGPNAMSGAFESQVNKHKTNMIMGGAVAVLGLGGAFFIYKF